MSVRATVKKEFMLKNSKITLFKQIKAIFVRLSLLNMGYIPGCFKIFDWLLVSIAKFCKPIHLGTVLYPRVPKYGRKTGKEENDKRK